MSERGETKATFLNTLLLLPFHTPSICPSSRSSLPKHCRELSSAVGHLALRCRVDCVQIQCAGASLVRSGRKRFPRHFARIEILMVAKQILVGAQMDGRFDEEQG